MLWDLVYLITGLDSSKFNKGLYVAALTALLFYVITFIARFIPYVNAFAFTYPTIWFITILGISSMRAFGMSDTYLLNGLQGRYDQ